MENNGRGEVFRSKWRCLPQLILFFEIIRKTFRLLARALLGFVAFSCQLLNDMLIVDSGPCFFPENALLSQLPN